MRNNSRTLNSARNIFAGFISQGIVLGVGFINRMVFIRCLSAEYLGLNGLFTNILSMLSLAELGIGTAIVYALYKPLAENDERQIAILMKFFAKAYKAIGLFVAVIGIGLLPFLNQLIGEAPNVHENIYAVYLLYLFNTAVSYFFTYKSSLLIADQKNYILTIISSLVTIIQCAAQCLILLLTKNYLLYLICQVSCSLIYNFIISGIASHCYPFLRRYPKERLDAQTQHTLFTNVKALVITKISGILVNSTDNIIITALNGLAVTGINSNYVLLTSTLNGILNVIFSGMTASIGNANAVEAADRKKQIFYAINLLNFWLFGWCTISFIILANDLVDLFFGEQYLLSMDIVIIMAVNFYTVGMQNAVWTYNSTLGLFRYGRYLGLVTGALNIVLSIILGKQMGLFGILFATFLSRLFTNIWYSPYAVFVHGFHEKFSSYLRKYLMYILYLCITLLSTIILIQIPINNGVIFLLYKLFICIVFPNLIFFLIFKDKNEFQILRSKMLLLYKVFISRFKG